MEAGAETGTGGDNVRFGTGSRVGVIVGTEEGPREGPRVRSVVGSIVGVGATAEVRNPISGSNGPVVCG